MAKKSTKSTSRTRRNSKKSLDVQVDGDVLQIRIPIDVKPSSSGKTLLVASTHGGKRVEEIVFEEDASPLYVSLNAYYYPPRD